MCLELSTYRIAALAIGVSIATQVLQSLLIASPEYGGWFLVLTSLGLIAVGVATFLRFQLSQWVLDGSAIALGIIGGVTL